jgi:type IV pilus assembly protein PilV
MSVTNRSRTRGVTMIEVLITIVILTIGLLGVAGLQSRMQLAEVESYHRSHAIVLLQDIVARISANRRNAMNYVTGGPLGTGNAVQNCLALTGANLDLCQWNNALLGASETSSGGQQVGGMIGARGCITNVSATMPREFTVAVVWQGVTPTVAPTSTACGQGLYGNEQTRRALIARVKIGCLQNDPTTGVCVTP